jgi:Ca2+-transporting ATPase
MIIDPVCSLVFEAEPAEDDIMRRPPRAPGEALLTTRAMAWALIQGLLSAAVVGAIYFGARSRNMPPDEVRALAFFALVLSIAGLIFINRSTSPSLIKAIARPSPALLVVLAGVAVVLAASLLWPFAKNVFNFGPLHPDDLSICAGAAALLVVTLECVKWTFARNAAAHAKS